VRNETTGTDVGTISANPEQGGSINLEGANGFRLVLGAPTRGSYATGDQYAWSNTAYVPAMMNIPALNNSTTPTSGAAQVTMAGDGSGLTTANWSATYDGLNRRWTIRNETTASDVGTINAAPNAGGSLMNIEGANGFSVTIQAPGAGTEYNDGDRFTWTNQGFVAAQAGAGLLSPTTGYTAGSSSLAAAGDGSGVSAATWRATYDAVAQQWTVRNVTTATDVATIAALPNGGGFADLEGANGYRFSVNAPTSGQYTTGDYFQWTNTAGSVAGAASFTDNTTSVSGSMTNVTQGDGSGVSTANWSATYNAVTQQWSVRNETTSTQVGTISAAPNSGGSLALEGANGSLLTISAPTVSQYKSGDRFTWNNSAQIVQAVGSTTFHDDPGTTVGTASATRDGDSTSVTSAWWRATYNDLVGAWTISNETTGQTVGSIGAAPNAGVSYVNIEGLNGHTITINAPTSGLYNTGDYFRWRTTAHVPPVLPSPSFISAGAPAAGASVTYVGDGYDVTNANWHAQYDAVAQQWTVTNRTTGQVVGTINAAPNAGGSLTDIEGTDGFDFVINAPSGTSYSTGDEFTWTNQVHDPAIPGIADYTDANTLKVSLQVGPDSNQVFTEQEIVLEADYFKVIGSYVSYRYGSVNMTLLASFAHAVTWASLICPENVRIENQADAQGAVDKLNIGIDHLSSIRATLGAEMNRMEQTLSGLRNYEENVRATESRIRDVDIARETTEFARFQIMTQLSTALLAQANTLAGGVVQLLQ
jgi:flagellin-like hook-associated protein FlgL